MSKKSSTVTLKKNTDYLPAKPHHPLCFDLTIQSDLCMLDLRMNANDTKAVNALEKALNNLSLPTKPLTSSYKDETTILWLSFDQWLIIAPEKYYETITNVLQKALQTTSYYSLCDVSHMRSVFRLNGKGAKHTIHKGGSLDDTQAHFKDGFVKRMNFAEIPAIIHFVSCQKEKHIIDLYVFRSYANYVFDWLNQTGHKDAAL